jgi:hypothetical protein
MARDGREEGPPADGSSPAPGRGLRLFALYLLAYGVFVGLNAFHPRTMEAGVGGVPLAVIYGLALIAGAFVLALIHAVRCGDREGPR